VLKAVGSFGLRPQDDTKKIVILNEVPPNSAGRPSYGGQGRIPCTAVIVD